MFFDKIDGIHEEVMSCHDSVSSSSGRRPNTNTIDTHLQANTHNNTPDPHDVRCDGETGNPEGAGMVSLQCVGALGSPMGLVSDAENCPDVKSEGEIAKNQSGAFDGDGKVNVGDLGVHGRMAMQGRLAVSSQAQDEKACVGPVGKREGVSGVESIAEPVGDMRATPSVCGFGSRLRSSSAMQWADISDRWEREKFSISRATAFDVSKWASSAIGINFIFFDFRMMRCGVVVI